MSLPLQQTYLQDLSILQTKWKAILDPILINALIGGMALNKIQLIANTPQTINHYLGHQMQGWYVIDKDSNANVWRTQPLNNTTLTLEASANTTLSLWVF